MSNDYLWDGSGEPDPEIEKLEKVLGRLRQDTPAAVFIETKVREISSVAAREERFFWLARLAAAAVVIFSVIGAGVVLRQPMRTGGSNAGWQIVSVDGTSRVGREVIRSGQQNAKLEIGESLITSSDSRATLSVAGIGQLELEPDTHVRLLESGSGRKRVALERGTVRAAIWAPPGEFVVNTPSAMAVDLGCVYTLQVDHSGGGTLHTMLGWVGFQQGGHESFIPAGAMCSTRANAGPGTPYFEDASEVFRKSLFELDFGTESRADRASLLGIVLQESRPRDAISLWHLLTRVNEEERQDVYQRLASLVPPPGKVTRDGILRLDPTMMDAWWNQFGLGDISLWRAWKQRWPQDQRASN